MPNICVAPMSVAAREAGKFVVAMYTAPTSANTPPAPCRNRPTLAAVTLPVREEQRPDSHHGRADRHDARGPSRSIADAGDQAERRIAVVEQPHHRGDAHRADPERLRQLRHHDRRRRPHDVLVEVVDRRDQPGDQRARLDRPLTHCSRLRLTDQRLVRHRLT